MKQPSFGATIAALRKEQGLTQLALAEKMGVTDKAVSKWERNLSFPDINSIPRLAEIFHVTADELLHAQTETKKAEDHRISKLVRLVWQGIALAMGIAVTVLSLLREVETQTAVCMLGIGLASLAVSQLPRQDSGPL